MRKTKLPNQKLHLSKAGKEAILRAIPDLMFVMDKDGVFLDYKAEEASLLYAQPDEFLGRNIFDVLPHEVAEKCGHYLERTLQAGKVHSFEYSLPMGSGFCEYEARLVAISEDEALIIVRDVTERKKVEKKLSLAEEKFRFLSQQFITLLNAVPYSIFVLSPDMKATWANRGAELALGKDLSGIIGQHCHALWHNSASPCKGCPTIKSFRTGTPGSNRISKRDGKIWEVRAFPIKTEDGRTDSVINIAVDVTHQLNLQAVAERNNRLAYIGELAAGVAHEINNPINGIINYAQLLKDENSPGSDAHDISGRIVAEGCRIADIVRSLLLLARDKKGEKRETVDIAAIIERSLMLVSAKMKKDGIKIKVNTGNSLPGVIACDQQIQQVFMNILHNAHYALNQKYQDAHKDKIIEISCETVKLEGSLYVRTTFHDQGTGIPKGIVERIMNPFFTTKPPGAGTGLGLSISHGIVNDHGGQVVIRSAEGEFTKVVIDLPAEKNEG